MDVSEKFCNFKISIEFPPSILFWRFFLRLFSLVIAFVAVYNVVSCDYALGCEDDDGDQGRFCIFN